MLLDMLYLYAIFTCLYIFVKGSEPVANVQQISLIHFKLIIICDLMWYWTLSHTSYKISGNKNNVFIFISQIKKKKLFIKEKASYFYWGKKKKTFCFDFSSISIENM